MKYNTDYIDIQYSLIQSLMIGMEENVLDISYNTEGRAITIQVVVLEGTTFSDSAKKKAFESLNDFEVKFNEIVISKRDFNESTGFWQPKCYTQMKSLLFSKDSTK